MTIFPQTVISPGEHRSRFLKRQHCWVFVSFHPFILPNLFYNGKTSRQQIVYLRLSYIKLNISYLFLTVVTTQAGNYFRPHIRNTHKSINRKLNRWSGRLFMFPDPMAHIHHSYYSFTILEVYCNKWVNKQQLAFFIRNSIWHTRQLFRSKMCNSYQFHTQRWHALIIHVCSRNLAHSRSNHLSYQVCKKRKSQMQHGWNWAMAINAFSNYYFCGWTTFNQYPSK